MRKLLMLSRRRQAGDDIVPLHCEYLGPPRFSRRPRDLVRAWSFIALTWSFIAGFAASLAVVLLHRDIAVIGAHLVHLIFP